MRSSMARPWRWRRGNASCRCSIRSKPSEILLECPDLDFAKLLGGFRKLTIEAHERLASVRLRKVKSVGEIHPASRPVERLCAHRCILQGHAWQSGKSAERLGDLDPRETLDAAQHPFGFEENRRTDEDVL